jgi:hypothetical protein
MAEDPALRGEVQKLNQFRRRMWGEIAAAVPGAAGDVRRGMSVDEAVKAHLRPRPNKDLLAKLKADAISDWQKLQGIKAKEKAGLIAARRPDKDLIATMLESSVKIAQAQGDFVVGADRNIKVASVAAAGRVIDLYDNATQKALGSTVLDEAVMRDIVTAVSAGMVSHDEAGLGEVNTALAALTPGQVIVATDRALKVMAENDKIDQSTLIARLEETARNDPQGVTEASKLLNKLEKARELKGSAEFQEAQRVASSMATAVIEEAFDEARIDLSKFQDTAFNRIVENMVAKGFILDPNTDPEELSKEIDDSLGESAPDPASELASLLEQFESDPYTLREARDEFFATDLWKNYVKKTLGSEWDETSHLDPQVRRRGLRMLRADLKEVGAKTSEAMSRAERNAGGGPLTPRSAPSGSAQLASDEGQSEPKKKDLDSLNPDEWEFTALVDKESLGPAHAEGKMGSYTIVARKKATSEVLTYPLEGMPFEEAALLLKTAPDFVSDNARAEMWLAEAGVEVERAPSGEVPVDTPQDEVAIEAPKLSKKPGVLSPVKPAADAPSMQKPRTTPMPEIPKVEMVGEAVGYARNALAGDDSNKIKVLGPEKKGKKKPEEALKWGEDISAVGSITPRP